MPVHPLQNYANEAVNVIKKHKNIFNQFYIKVNTCNIPGSENLKQSSLKISYENGKFVISSSSFFGKNFNSGPISFNQFTDIVKHSGINLVTPKDPELQKVTQAQQIVNQNVNQRQPHQQAVRPASHPTPLTPVARVTPLPAGQPKGQASQVVQHQTPPPPANTAVRDKRSANHRDRLEKLVNPAPLPAGTPIASLATNQSSATTAQPQYGKLPANGTNTIQNSAGINEPAKSPSIFGAFSAASFSAATAGQASPQTTPRNPVNNEQLPPIKAATGQAPNYDVVPSITDPRKREMPKAPTMGQASSQADPTRPSSTNTNPATSVNAQVTAQPSQPTPTSAMSRERQIQKLPIPPTAGQPSGVSQPNTDRRPQGVCNAQQLAASASSNSNVAPKPAAVNPGATSARVMGNLNDIKAPSTHTPKSK